MSALAARLADLVWLVPALPLAAAALTGARVLLGRARGDAAEPGYVAPAATQPARRQPPVQAHQQRARQHHQPEHVVAEPVARGAADRRAAFEHRHAGRDMAVADRQPQRDVRGHPIHRLEQ